MLLKHLDFDHLYYLTPYWISGLILASISKTGKPKLLKQRILRPTQLCLMCSWNATYPIPPASFLAPWSGSIAPSTKVLACRSRKLQVLYPRIHTWCTIGTLSIWGRRELRRMIRKILRRARTVLTSQEPKIHHSEIQTFGLTGIHWRHIFYYVMSKSTPFLYTQFTPLGRIIHKNSFFFRMWRFIITQNYK